MIFVLTKKKDYLVNSYPCRYFILTRAWSKIYLSFILFSFFSICNILGKTDNCDDENVYPGFFILGGQLLSTWNGWNSNWISWYQYLIEIKLWVSIHVIKPYMQFQLNSVKSDVKIWIYQCQTYLMRFKFLNVNISSCITSSNNESSLIA